MARRVIRSGHFPLVGLVMLVAWQALVSAAAQAGWRLVYSEPFDQPAESTTVLNDQITLGPIEGSGYTIRLVAGALEISNDSDPQTSRYFTLVPVQVPEWQTAANAGTAVSIRVSGDYLENPGIGLVYRVDPVNGWFYAFMLTGGSNYILTRFSGGDFFRLITGQSQHILPGKPNRLSVSSTGAVLNLFINDHLVATIEDTTVNGLGVGIMVAGTGRFVLDDFEIYVAQ